MNNFINYHQHSFASFLDGIAKPDDIAKRCKELGMTHAMVTDHGNVAGHIQFIKACRKAGIKPIVGTELYVKDDRYDNGRPKGYHLLLWALNTEGMHNIWSISSNTYYATSQDHRTPNTRWEHMEGHGAGVVCSSACMGGMLSEAAKNNDYDEADYLVEKCKAIFDEFAVEIHTNDEEGQHKVNLWLMKYAKSRGLRVVYSVDSHYVWPEDAEFHDVWLGMATRSHYDEDHWRMKHQYYIHSEQEVRDALAYLGEEDVQRCFDGVGELLAKVEPVALDNSHKVAKADIPEGFKDSNQYFLYLVAKNLFEKVGGVRTWLVEGRPGEFKAETVPDENLPILTEALHVLQDKELPIIIDNGLADYFLMVSDYAYWAKKHMLVGPGRGSAAASLICYLLNITSINPMGQGLVFERFLNQGRLGTYAVSFEGADDIEYGEHVTVRTDSGDVPVSTVKEGATVYGRLDYRGEFEPYDRALKVRKIIFHGGELPDIDLDFEGRKRWMLERHLVEKYGEDKVTAVGTTLYYKMSLALQDVCRYYRIPHPDTLKLTAVVGRLEEAATGNETWRDRLMVTDPADRAMVEGYERDYPDLFRYAERMVGLPRQQGKHAAGYVISPVSLTSELPVRKAFPSKTEEDVIGQFDKYETEDLGFVKADILGLRNLDTLALMADMVEERTGERIDWYGLKDNPDDMAIWSLFDEGRTLGLFQCESKGVTGVAQAVKPRSIQDIAVIIALYRPGVIDAGMLDEYLDRATGKKPVEFLDPALEPILSDTCGVIVFQEQAMQIFKELGGFTDREADQLRAAIGHKSLEQLNAMKPKFIAGCVARNIPQRVAEQVFSQVEASGRYSFNKGHSISYGTVTFWTAWAKAHHPVEYLAASMSTVGDKKAPEYMAEARHRGIRISPPSVLKPTCDYTILSDDEMAFGLVNVKGVGDKAIAKIVDGAPYRDFCDFVERSGANSKVIKTLVDGSFFREWEPNARKLKLMYEEGTYRPNLFGDALVSEAVPYPVERVAEIETGIYGMPLTVDPFQPYREKLGTTICDLITRDFDSLPVKGQAVALARVTEVRGRTDRKGNPMAFLTLVTDDDVTVEATCFGSMWGPIRKDVHEGTIALFGLTKDLYNGRTSWQVSNIKRFHREGD